MEKGEPRDTWSSGSSGPSSEGSEYSVANQHYYQKYELIYQHSCSLAAWHSQLVATEARLLEAISELAVPLTPHRPKLTALTTPSGLKWRRRRSRGGWPTTSTNATVVGYKIVKKYMVVRLHWEIIQNRPILTYSLLARGAAGPTPSVLQWNDLFSILCIAS